MKGDFSRIRFNSGRQYTSVLEQQGRVALDADSNEQCAIDEHLRRTEIVDVIGQYGAPANDAGFSITISDNEVLIGAGRYYVNGLMCENSASLAYGSQPFLLDTAAADSSLLAQLAQYGDKAAIRIFLEVWQRLVTALDDPCLLEPALGQADTTARLQTVWRVVAHLTDPNGNPITTGSSFPGQGDVFRRLEATTQKELLQKNTTSSYVTGVDTNRITLAGTPIQIGKLPIGKLPTRPRPTPPSQPVPPPAPPDCCSQMYLSATTLSTGAFAAATGSGNTDCSCDPVPSAGYQGLENQLYRIEIHQSGDETTATFKWSRENASIVVAVQDISGATVTVTSLGPDANLGFQAGQWVEMTDDTFLFGDIPNTPGNLYQILKADPANLTLTMATSVLPVDLTRNPRLRRWDQTDPSATSDGTPLFAGNWLPLENGIQIGFSAGTYQSGDYWTIPARAATGQIDWPPCGSDGNLYQSPHSIRIYHAPLACIHWNPQEQGMAVEDCRRIFSPLTALTTPTTSQALHVTKINWANDTLVTADRWVANGLNVILDGAPSSPITSGNFIVTIEPVFDVFATESADRIASLERATSGKLVPSTFVRNPSILDSTISVSGSSISWSMPYVDANALQRYAVNAIDAGILFGLLLNQYARVRVRLIGHSIYSGSGTALLYLDGQSFGETTTDAAGNNHVDLQFPSGNDEKASDFESWFYVSPTLDITSVTVAY